MILRAHLPNVFALLLAQPGRCTEIQCVTWCLQTGSHPAQGRINVGRDRSCYTQTTPLPPLILYCPMH